MRNAPSFVLSMIVMVGASAVCASAQTQPSSTFQEQCAALYNANQVSLTASGKTMDAFMASCLSAFNLTPSTPPQTNSPSASANPASIQSNELEQKLPVGAIQ
jgi:hypothetical protein